MQSHTTDDTGVSFNVPATLSCSIDGAGADNRMAPPVCQAERRQSWVGHDWERNWHSIIDLQKDYRTKRSKHLASIDGPGPHNVLLYNSGPRKKGVMDGFRRSIEILLVEDNSTDILLTKEALVGAKVPNKLHVVNDGVQAMLFLRKQGQYADKPRPDLILLDLNLPIKGGFEVLAELKGDVRLKHIPVVVLTTSTQAQDIVRAYDNGANCYIAKPIDVDQFCHLMEAIEHFWFSIVTLPPR